MSRIILIETSTALCSVALEQDGKVVAARESDAPKAHAAMTAPFVKQVLEERGLTVKDCDAVCVSAGPGSYTGLRVGVSTAKGLCFATGLPLLAVGTLDILARQAMEEGLPGEIRHIIPMVDARRMEVYTAIYSTGGRRLTEVEPRIVDGETFRGILSEGPAAFIGDGAGKCRDAIASPGSLFIQTCPKAGAMASLAEEALKAGDIKDCAYFEPFYLKQFIATTSKKKLF